MGYYDDDDAEYGGYYSDDDDQEAPVSIAGYGFSERAVSESIYSAGLTPDKTPRLSGTMERMVFMHGEDSEVYSRSEIRFIESIDTVYIYPDFYKQLNRGNMACRTIATRINLSGHDALRACVSFEKIMNKAFDGFNIFFFVTDEKVFVGCRIFDKKGDRDCALSKPIVTESKFEQVVDELSYSIDHDSFMEFYKQFQMVILEGQDGSFDYEGQLSRRRGVQYTYLESIRRLEEETGIDMSRERYRYRLTFDEEPEENFVALLEEVKDSLSFIKSNRINTYEMLFEADEAMRQAEQVEAENTYRSSQVSAWGDDSDDDEEAESLLDDPEEMIKLLKKRRGL